MAQRARRSSSRTDQAHVQAHVQAGLSPDSAATVGGRYTSPLRQNASARKQPLVTLINLSRRLLLLRSNCVRCDYTLWRTIKMLILLAVYLLLSNINLSHVRRWIRGMNTEWDQRHRQQAQRCLGHDPQRKKRSFYNNVIKMKIPNFSLNQSWTNYGQTFMSGLVQRLRSVLLSLCTCWLSLLYLVVKTRMHWGKHVAGAGVATPRLRPRLTFRETSLFLESRNSLLLRNKNLCLCSRVCVSL